MSGQIWDFGDHRPWPVSEEVAQRRADCIARLESTETRNETVSQAGRRDQAIPDTPGPLRSLDLRKPPELNENSNP